MKYKIIMSSGAEYEFNSYLEQYEQLKRLIKIKHFHLEEVIIITKNI